MKTIGLKTDFKKKIKITFVKLFDWTNSKWVLWNTENLSYTK